MQFGYGESWFEMMKALLKRSHARSYRRQTDLFTHFKYNFTIILLPKVSMGYICTTPVFSLHCKALELSSLIYVEANCWGILF